MHIAMFYDDCNVYLIDTEAMTWPQRDVKSQKK